MCKLLTFTPSITDPVNHYEDLIACHREYWNFIADNRLDYKPEIVGIREDVYPYARCFLCVIARFFVKDRCPAIEWNCSRDKCGLSCTMLVDSLYNKWKSTGNPEYARQIANIEVYPDLEHYLSGTP